MFFLLPDIFIASKDLTVTVLTEYLPDGEMTGSLLCVSMALSCSIEVSNAIACRVVTPNRCATSYMLTALPLENIHSTTLFFSFVSTGLRFKKTPYYDSDEGMRCDRRMFRVAELIYRVTCSRVLWRNNYSLNGSQWKDYKNHINHGVQ